MSNYFSKDSKKVVRGSYTYTKNGHEYAQENFDVFVNNEKQQIIYKAEFHSRVTTGEMLIIRTDFHVEKDYTPKYVNIEKVLGNKLVRETFRFQKLHNKVHYEFDNGDGRFETTFSTPPRFQIATPTASTDFIFLKMKKITPTEKTSMPILQSTNMWNFEDEPEFKTMLIEKESISSQNLVIDGKTIQAHAYKIRNAEDGSGKGDETIPTIYLQMSEYYSVPYTLKDKEGNSIEVKFLNYFADT